MKIGSFDPHNKAIVPAGNGSPSSATSGKAAAGVAEPEASAQVALSPAAALTVNDSNADFDAEKVARIAQAIRDGKFEVNAEAIADRLIDHAKDLLAGPQH